MDIFSTFIDTKYNFMSLLNLPDAMAYFGPLRQYWKGSTIGEKIVTAIKQKFHKTHSQWTRSTLLNVNVDQVWTYQPSTKIKPPVSRKNYILYPNWESVNEILLGG